MVGPRLSLIPAVLLLACGGEPGSTTEPDGPDTQPPTVDITEPTSSGSHATEEMTITFSGTASDDRGVTKVLYDISDGQSGLAEGTTSWSFSVTLPHGEHTVTVRAEDAAGNNGTAALSLTILEPPPPMTPTVSAPERLNVEEVGTASIESQGNSTYAWSISGGEIVSGATTPQITFRPFRAGPVQLAATVTNSLDETSEPGEAVVQAFATVTTILGDGVEGVPESGTVEYEGGSVEFSYSPSAGASRVRVDVDGSISESAEGELAMDRNHTVWAWQEPAVGTQFQDMVVVPTEPNHVPYPDFFGNRPATSTVVADPICSVTSPHLAYPASFLGSYEIPEASGAPLPADVARGIILKDYWVGGHPTGNEGCSPHDWYDALDRTLGRVAALGSDHVSLFQSMVLEDVDAEVLRFDCLGTPTCTGTHAGAQIPDPDIIWTAQRAAAHGLDTYLYVQVALVDDSHTPLPPDPGLEWVHDFFDAYREYMVHIASVSEEAGIQMLQVSWVGWGTEWQRGGRDEPDGTPDYRSAYVERMTEIAAEIRGVFSGKLGHNLINTYQAADDAALMEQIDWLIIDPFRLDPRAKDNTDYTVEMAKEWYDGVLQDHAVHYAEFGKPALFFLFAQSHEDYLDEGWIEDGFCTDGCPQRDVATDFSVQALSLQAQFESLMDQTAFPAVAVDVNAYWYADVILPQFGFPNLSQSIRGKPAEALVYQWFRP